MAATSQIALPDRYRVLHHVARGGMASVWAAQDRVLERRVAVKVLASHLAGDAGARERFQREARAAARVSAHPHVVTIFDVGEHEGNAFIVMEHMTGGSLAEQVRSGGAIDPGRAVRWLTEAASALDAAHAEGIVHRDVKPANLLLDARERLAVADFGIARLAADSAMTQTGMVMGTAAYLSPEQAEGGAATEASDRYALAVVAYELLTGERPFRAEHAAAQARQHIQAERPRASLAAPQLPAGLDAVLIEGLALDPDRRPPTAGALAEQIREVLDATGTTAAAAGAATYAPPGEEPQPATSPPERDEPEPEPPLPESESPPPEPEPPLPEPESPLPEPEPPDPVTPVYRSRAPEPEPLPVRDGPAPRRRWIGVLVGALVCLLVVGAIAAALVGGGEEPASTRADDPPASPSATDPEAESDQPAPEPERESAPEPEREPAPEEPPAEDADPVALNDEGYSLSQAGDHAAAVEPLRQSVSTFEAQGRTDELEYAFALYNLGRALNRSGQPAEAIPVLERRLEINSENQPGVVREELADARAAAG